MVPPEVILDRYVRTVLSKAPGCSSYIGKLDLESVESPSFRSFLYLIQETLNEALRLEGVNASGGVEHPPFHFDYLQVRNGEVNAHAFEHDGYAFIVLNLPLVELVWILSHNLSRSQFVGGLLNINPGIEDRDGLHGLFFQIQLFFLVSHEYTHHIHRHDGVQSRAADRSWTEFLNDASSGSVNSQAQELDADGFAACLVLSFLLRGERRQTALEEFGLAHVPGIEGDEPLLTCFFLAVLASFCAFWDKDIDMASVHRYTHPPPPVRITYLIRVAEMWCRDNGSVPQSWFLPARFQEFFRAASELVDTPKQIWGAQMTFLRSLAGADYDRQLLERFDAIRQKRDETSPSVVTSDAI